MPILSTMPFHLIFHPFTMKFFIISNCIHNWNKKFHNYKHRILQSNFHHCFLFFNKCVPSALSERINDKFLIKSNNIFEISGTSVKSLLNSMLKAIAIYVVLQRYNINIIKSLYLLLTKPSDTNASNFSAIAVTTEYANIFGASIPNSVGNTMSTRSG